MRNAPYREFPESIETSRLVIRPIRPGDGEKINEAIRETYDELHRWMEWATHLPSVKETEEFCRQAAQNFAANKDIALLACLKDVGTFVLGTGLHSRDWSTPKFEIGYWCRTSFQRQGYVTEAVNSLTLIGFEAMKANRIEIRCDARNARSRQVAERAGYRLETVIHNDQSAPGGPLRDTLVFVMLPEEFKLARVHHRM